MTHATFTGNYFNESYSTLLAISLATVGRFGHVMYIAMSSSEAFNATVTFKLVSADTTLNVKLSNDVIDSINPRYLQIEKDVEIFIKGIINYLTKHNLFHHFLELGEIHEAR